MDRRSYLGGLGVSVAALAGCTAPMAQSESSLIILDESDAEPEIIDAEPPENRNGEDMVRADGPALTVEQNVDRDTVRYDLETDEVSYVAARRQGEQIWKTVSFERWGKVETAQIAQRAVHQYLADQLEFEIETALSIGVTSRTGTHVVFVNRVDDEKIPLDELEAITPVQVKSTMRLAENSYTAVVPVFIDDSGLPLRAD